MCANSHQMVELSTIERRIIAFTKCHEERKKKKKKKKRATKGVLRHQSLTDSMSL